jgi:DNA-binding response OmpR family regulator
LPNHKSILILDDEFDIVSLIKRSLHQNGFCDVFAFTEPSLAFEHFQINSNSYGLVISDIRMPGMTGFEFVRRVKDINSKVRVVFMSAFDINDIEFSKVLPSSIKIDGFMRKPFLPSELLKLIDKQLNEIGEESLDRTSDYKQY